MVAITDWNKLTRSYPMLTAIIFLFVHIIHLLNSRISNIWNSNVFAFLFQNFLTTL